MRLIVLLYYADNFHLFGTGIDTGRQIQLFSDSSVKLGLNDIKNVSVGSGDEELQCTAAPHVGSDSMENRWHIEQMSGRVRLYFMTENGKKWYLRAHFLGTRIDLVCEDYVNSIDNVSLHKKGVFN